MKDHYSKGHLKRTTLKRGMWRAEKRLVILIGILCFMVVGLNHNNLQGKDPNELQDSSEINSSSLPMHTMLYKFGIQGSGDGEFFTPRGIAINRTGYVYVADWGNNRVQVFTSTGVFIRAFGGNGTGDGQFNRPTSIAINRSGEVYVVDSLNNRIQVFSAVGDYLFEWGELGVNNGQFYNPQGITINSSGIVYVSDTLNHRIQIFQANGTHIQTWGDYNSGSEEGDFNRPMGLAINDTGYVFVSDSLNNRIQVFDSVGNFQYTWGSSGNEEGQFAAPSSLTFNRTGQAYVSDTDNHRIQVFYGNGTNITSFGSIGSDDNEFRYPYQVAINHTGYIYVVDSDNHRIQVFQAPPQPDFWVTDPIDLTEGDLDDSDNYDLIYGDGTDNSPYVVENLLFRGDGTSPLLSIDSTTSVIEIRNCRFENGSIGINLDGVRNLRIHNCTFDGYNISAISLQNTSNIMIYNTSFEDILYNSENYHGAVIWANQSSSLNISDNLLATVPNNGFSLTGVNNSIITANLLEGSPEGYIFLNHTQNITLNDMNVTSYSAAEKIIQLYSCNQTIFDNITIHNSNKGMDFVNSTLLSFNDLNLMHFGDIIFRFQNVNDSAFTDLQTYDSEEIFDLTMISNISIADFVLNISTSVFELNNVSQLDISEGTIVEFTDLLIGQNIESFSMDSLIIAGDEFNSDSMGMRIQNLTNCILNDLAISNVSGVLAANNTSNLTLSNSILNQDTEYALLLNDAINISIIDNTFTNFYGYNRIGSYLDGGDAYVLSIEQGSEINLTNNEIENLTAGFGAAGNGVGEGNNGMEGGNAIGFRLIDLVNVTVNSNNLSFIYGGAGGSPSNNSYFSAGNGGAGIGVSLENITSSVFSNLIIQDLIGGTGGYTLATGEVGGTGGDSFGIYLDSSNENQFSSNKFYDINSSTGGNGPGYDGPAGGHFAFYFLEDTSYNNEIASTNLVEDVAFYYFYNQSNIVLNSLTLNSKNPSNLGYIVILNAINITITNCYLGNNIWWENDQYLRGRPGKNGKNGTRGEDGEDMAAIFILNASNVILSSTITRDIYGGAGGNSGTNTNGTLGGNAYGALLQNVVNISMLLDNFQAIGGAGGDAGHIYTAGGYGGNGGNATAVHFENCENITLTNRYDYESAGSGGSGEAQNGASGSRYFANLINSNHTSMTFDQTLGKSYTEMVNYDENSHDLFWVAQVAPERKSTETHQVEFFIDHEALNSSSIEFIYRVDDGSWTTINSSSSTTFDFTDPMMENNEVWDWYVQYNLTSNETRVSPVMDFLTDDNPPWVFLTSDSGSDVYKKEEDTIQFSLHDDHSLYSNRYQWDSHGWIGGYGNGTVFVWASQAGYLSETQTIYYEFRDLAGNWNSTSAVYTLDFVDPVIELVSPIGYYSTEQDFDIQLNLTDNLYLYDVYYNWDSGEDGPWTPLSSPYAINVTGLSEGAHLLHVIAYDKAGNDFYTNYTFEIDLTAPVISIKTGSGGYYRTPPSIRVNVTDSFSLDALVYYIDSGENYTIFSNSGATTYEATFGVNSALFNSLDQGYHRVYFMATDDLGNLRNNTAQYFYFYKDTIAPNITITTLNDQYYIDAPSIDIELEDNLKLRNAYYKIDSYSPTGTSTTDWVTIFTNRNQPTYSATLNIDQELWDDLSQGSHTIYFKAWDYATNVNSTSDVNWTFLKDDIIPTATFNITNGSIFAKPFSFNVTFSDEILLNSCYYQINSYSPTGYDTTGWTPIFESDLTNTSRNFTYTIEQALWDSMGQGYQKFYFKLTDHAGNFWEGSDAYWQFYKDTQGPLFTINDENGTYWNQNPLFDIDIWDPSGLNDVYYRVDEFSSGPNVTGWTLLVEDPAGFYYTTDFSFSTALWNNLTEGSHVIYFKAWDDLDNYAVLANNSLQFYKDITTPTYVIEASKLVNNSVYMDPPKVYVKFDDLMEDSPGNLTGVYYQIDGNSPTGINTAGWTAAFEDVDDSSVQTGFLFDSDLWDSLEDGIHTMYLKVIDDAGNVEDNFLQTWIFVKDSTPPAISLFNCTDYYSTVSTFDVNVSIDLSDYAGAEYKWDETSYGSFSEDFISEATSLSDGTHLLWIRAWDEVGNVLNGSQLEPGNYNEVSYTFKIDQTSPYYSFQSTNLTYYNETFSFTVDLNDTYTLDSAYYQIDGISPSGQTITGWNEIFLNSSLSSQSETISLPSVLWDELDEGIHYIAIKVWDDLGNNNDSCDVRLYFYKDTIAPNFTFISSQNEYFNTNPTIEVNVNDTHSIYYGYYQVDGYMPGAQEITGWVELFADYSVSNDSFDFSLETAEWNALSEGFHQVYLKVWDRAGNVNNSIIYTWNFTKDTVAPTITINSMPTYFSGMPTLSVDFADVNTLDSAYYKIDSYTPTGQDTTGWVEIFADVSNASYSGVPITTWGSLSEGSYVIYFKVWDDVGNVQDGEAYNYSFYKDTTAPTYIINLANGTYFNYAPTIDIDFADNYALNAAYYQIDSTEPTGTTTSSWTEIFSNDGTSSYETNFTLNSGIFSGLEEGSHILYVKMWDMAGNLNDSCEFSWQFYVDTIEPNINIISPNNIAYNSTPTFTVEFNDTFSLNSAYYKIDSSVPSDFTLTDWVEIFTDETGNNGSYNIEIDSGLWEGLSQGSHIVYLKIWDNATNLNNSFTMTWTFIKDTTAPAITVNTAQNQHFNETFSLDVDFTDSYSLDGIYYQVASYTPGGLNVTNWAPIESDLSNSSFTADFMFSSAIWDGLSEGTYYLYFKAIDDLDNYNDGDSPSLQFTKDEHCPTYTFFSSNHSYYNSAPTISMGIADDYSLDSAYYQIDSFSPNDFDTTGWTEIFSDYDLTDFESSFTISGTIWNNLTEGSHTIYIKVWDDATNINNMYGEVLHFVKDTEAPVITITTANGSVRYDNRSFDVEFDDTFSLSNAFFQVDSYLPTGTNTTNWQYIFLESESTHEEFQIEIPEITWNALSDGTHRIYFKAKDYIGNVNDGELPYVEFIKDTTAPLIIINDVNGSRYNDPFLIDVDFEDVNSLDEIYYKVDSYSPAGYDTTDWILIESGLSNSSYYADFLFDSDVWVELGEGTHTIYFKVWDDLANLNASAAPALQFYVDLTFPEYGFVSSNQSYYRNTPTFTVEFSDDQALNNAYYQVDENGWVEIFSNADNLTATSYFTVDSGLWSSLGQGTHTIYLRVVDKATNLNESGISLEFIKDDIAPAITVVSAEPGAINANPTIEFQLNDTFTLASFYYKIDSYSPTGSATTDWNLVYGEFSSNNNQSTFSFSGEIWDALSDGEHIVYFKAFDEIGNYNDGASPSWTFTKDSQAPTFTFLSANNTYVHYAPELIISFNDLTSLDSAYYQINSSLPTGNNITGWYPIFVNSDASSNVSTFTINTTLWSTFDEGIYHVYIKVWDDLGHYNDSGIIYLLYYKDFSPPRLYLNSENGTYFNSAPTVDIDFYDGFRVDAAYYQIDNYTPNGTLLTNWEEIFSSYEGKWYTDNFTIDEALWNSLSEGTHVMYFKVFDSAQNYNLTLEVAWQFYKDTYAPNITFITDQNTIRYDNRSFDVVFDDSYTLDSGYFQVDSYSPTGLTITSWEVAFSDSALNLESIQIEIPELIWSELSDGTHRIYFKVWDDAGNINDGSTPYLDFIKDTTAPEISINDVNGSRYNAPFLIDVDFDDTNSLDELYYKVDSYSPAGYDTTDWVLIDLGLNNASYSADFLLDSDVWDGLDEGTHLIYFKAWDNLDNLNASSVYCLQFYVDLTAPEYGFVSANSTSFPSSPSFIVEFSDEQALDSAYYQIDSNGWVNIFSSADNLTATSSFTLESALWLSLGEGSHLVSLRVIDMATNLNESGIVLEFIKDSMAPNITIITANNTIRFDNRTFDVEFDDTFTLDSAYFQVDAYTPTGTTTSSWEILFSGSEINFEAIQFEIPELIWDELSDGTHYIYFKVWDDLENTNDGNLPYLQFIKDTTAPIITINDLNDSRYNAPFLIDVDFADVNSLDEVYYKIDSYSPGGYDTTDWIEIAVGLNNASIDFDFLLDSDIWTGLNEGSHVIYFKAWDDLDNLNASFHSIRFYKDISLPTFDFTTLNQSYFPSEPSFILSFADNQALDSAFYQVDGNGWIEIYDDAFNLTATSYITLGSGLWTSLDQGSHTLYLRVTDEATNLNQSGTVLIFYKDTYSPNITIISANNSIRRDNRTFEVNFDDTFTLDSAYYQIDSYTPTGTTTTDWVSLFTGSTNSLESIEFDVSESLWNSLSEGTHYIYFKVWDDVDNYNDGELPYLVFIKDTTAPEFTISTTNGTRYNAPFLIDVDFEDVNSLANLYYKVDSYSPGGLDTTGWIEIEADLSNSSYSYNFELNAAVWNGLGDGTHTIYFKAWDDLENTNDTSLYAIQFYKDISLPTFGFISSNQSYYPDEPTFTVSFADNQALDSAFYQVDSHGWVEIFDGALNLSATSFFTLESGLWLSLSQGTHTISLLVNDEATNQNQSGTVLIFYKDTYSPNITIISANNSIRRDNLTFEVDFDDTFTLDSAYYQIDSYTPTGTTTTDWISLFTGSTNSLESIEFDVSESLWNSLAEGTHYIYFKVWDDVDNYNDGALPYLVFIKDTTAPQYTINSENGTRYNIPFLLDVDFTDGNSLDDLYYKVDSYIPGGQDTTGWIAIETDLLNASYSMDFILDSAIWAGLSDGTHTIYFKAWDDLGNVNVSSGPAFQFFKDTTLPEYYFITANGSYYNSSPILTIAFSDNQELNASYYKVDSGDWEEIFITAQNLTASLQIDLGGAIWDLLDEGSHTISLRVSDIAGNTNQSGILLEFFKDTILPYLNIQSANGTYHNESYAFNGIAYDETIIDAVYYQIDSYLPSGGNLDSWVEIFSGYGSNGQISNSFNITLSSLVWDALSEGTHYIYFKVFDITGNVNDSTYCISFIKDTEYATWDFISQNNTISRLAPSISVNIEDHIQLDDAFYRIDGGEWIVIYEDAYNLSSVNVFVIDDLVWGALNQGEHVIEISVMDYAGNWNLSGDTLVILKDTVSPHFMLSEDGLYYNSTPMIEFQFMDEYALDRCYYQVDSYLPGGFDLENWTVVYSGLENSSIHSFFEIDGLIWDGLTEGTHTVYFKFWDGVDNIEVNTTLAWTFIKDITAPNYSLNDENGSFWNAAVIFELNCTDNLRLNSVYYSIDNNESYFHNTSSWTLIDGSIADIEFLDNITLSPTVWAGLSEGSHFISIFVIDEAGNYAELAMFQNFTKDTISPEITLISPTELTYIWATDLIHFNISDANNLTLIQYSWNMSVENYSFESQTTLGLLTDFNISISPTLSSWGYYQLHIYATDIAGNIEMVEYWYRYDPVDPQIALSNNDLSVSIQTGTVLYWNITDNMELSGITYEWDSVNNTALTLNSIEVPLLGDGYHTLTVISIDGAGNMQSVSQVFLIDNTAPFILLLTDLSEFESVENNLSTYTMEYNDGPDRITTFQLSDEYNVSAWMYSWSSSLDKSSSDPESWVGFTPINSTAYNITLPQESGVYYLTIRARDVAGNIYEITYCFRINVVNDEWLLLPLIGIPIGLIAVSISLGTRKVSDKDIFLKLYNPV